MGIKFSSVVFLILAVFIVKISLENFGDAKANDSRALQDQEVKIKHNIKLSQK